MTAAVAPSVPHDSRDLALELHQLLKQLDPARWRPDLDALVRSRLHAVRTALGKLLDRFDAHGSLASLHAALGAGADAVYFGLDQGFNARARAANRSLASCCYTTRSI